MKNWKGFVLSYTARRIAHANFFGNLQAQENKSLNGDETSPPFIHHEKTWLLLITWKCNVTVDEWRMHPSKPKNAKRSWVPKTIHSSKITLVTWLGQPSFFVVAGRYAHASAVLDICHAVRPRFRHAVHPEPSKCVLQEAPQQPKNNTQQVSHSKKVSKWEFWTVEQRRGTSITTKQNRQCQRCHLCWISLLTNPV